MDAVSAYLASPMSDSLHDLWLNQCGLTGRDIAVFLHLMTRTPGVARKLHLWVLLVSFSYESIAETLTVVILAKIDWRKITAFSSKQLQKTSLHHT